MGKTVRKARITSKQRRSWCAQEKLMVVCYHEHGHSVKKTAEKFNIQRKQAWDKIDGELIRGAFKCCVISVREDGTEDDLIFD
ncbi:7805_t:CDS:2, partial [Paraglomus brasilianum]